LSNAHLAQITYNILVQYLPYLHLTAVLITGTVITDNGCAVPIVIGFKGTLPRVFQLQVFYMGSVSLTMPLGPFQIFLKIRGDIRSSRCTTSVVDTGGKWKNLKSEKFSLFLLDTLG
jgi:hypothetical protein